MAEPGIYLFTGPEIGEKNEAISNIRSQAEKDFGALEEYKYYASDIRIADLVSQLQNLSLFSSSLFIVVKNAELIKLKADIDLLASWIKDPGENKNILILVSDEKSIDSKLEKLVPSNHKKIFWELFEDRKKAWLINFFKKNDFKITSDAVDEILDLIENNTDTLKSECTKFFFCFEKGHEVTVKDVEKVLTHGKDETVFTLFEALTDISKSKSQRFETSLEIMQKILLIKSGSEKPLLAGLMSCFRKVKLWNSLHSNSKPTDTELKAAGFSKMFYSQYQNAAKIWTSGAVSSILALLANIDIKIIESNSSLSYTLMTSMIYSIVMKNGIFPSEYEV